MSDDAATSRPASPDPTAPAVASAEACTTPVLPCRLTDWELLKTGAQLAAELAGRDALDRDRE